MNVEAVHDYPRPVERPHYNAGKAAVEGVLVGGRDFGNKRRLR